MTHTADHITYHKHPRWALTAEARVWNGLMAIGMMIHRMASPHPSHPTFTITIPSTLAPEKRDIRLVCYAPQDYPIPSSANLPNYLFHRHTKHHPRDDNRAPGSRGSDRSGDSGTSHDQPSKPRRYPVVFNFHGGGFTLGTGTDDCRWADVLTSTVSALFVSVEYRCGPKYKFPSALDDCIDALLYLSEHADDMRLDRTKFVVNGFSSGGNMAITVPLRLAELKKQNDKEASERRAGRGKQGRPNDASANNGRQGEDDTRWGAAGPSSDTRTTGDELPRLSISCTICAVVAWYPSTDYTISRADRVGSMRTGRSKHESRLFSDLFDASYIGASGYGLDTPFLSPAKAPLEMLREGLPRDIVLVTCEWDMMLSEAEQFKERLEREAGKRVWYRMVPGVKHAWDKDPLLWKNIRAARSVYEDVARQLEKVLQDPEGGVEQSSEVMR